MMVNYMQFLQQEHVKLVAYIRCQLSAYQQVKVVKKKNQKHNPIFQRV